jgi:hypothetical protein
MKVLRITLCIASLATTIAACAAAPVEEAEETGQNRSALFFAPGDHDIIWSGPATYSASWATQAFKPFPALYIAQTPVPGVVRGVVHLSATTICHFSTFNETADRLYIQGSGCSGPNANLSVYLDCLKQTTYLACSGNVGVPGGPQSTITMTVDREEACSPGNCFKDSLEPYPKPDPEPGTPNGCPRGCSACGDGCCLRGERCGDSKCHIPDAEDEAVGGR